LAAVIRPPLLFFIVITPFLAGHFKGKLDSQVAHSSVRERTLANPPAAQTAGYASLYTGSVCPEGEHDIPGLLLP